MKVNNVSFVNFFGKPANYAEIDKFVTRSAQPESEDFVWLKDHGVTDIIDFGINHKCGFNEKKLVEELGMKYHNIPTISRKPKESQVGQYLDIIENIKSQGGKIHQHCMAGADRTGMYSFIYKEINHIGTRKENIDEWRKLGYHETLFPNMISWTINFLNNFSKK